MSLHVAQHIPHQLFHPMRTANPPRELSQLDRLQFAPMFLNQVNLRVGYELGLWGGLHIKAHHEGILTPIPLEDPHLSTTNQAGALARLWMGTKHESETNDQ